MKKRIREPKPINPALASANGPALIKYLASCNTSIRSQSLRLIQSWLVSQSHQLSPSDIKKLWKGLFYCMWHADKTPNQVALIDRFTSLFLLLQPSLSLEFFRGFLLTLRREWSGIDRLRLDKFYLLIRRFIGALFELMRLRKWDCEVLGQYVDLLEKNGFLAEDKLQGNGVNYHVVSVFLEELKGVKFPERKDVVDVILRPFFAVMMKSKDRILLGKVKNCIFDEILKNGKGLLEKKREGIYCNADDKDALLGVVALRMGLSAMLYEVGSSVECVQGNRKVVLGLHEEYLKLEKEFETSGIEVTLPEWNGNSHDGGNDEAPQLIPIHCSSGCGNDEFCIPEKDEGHVLAKSLKKCKKAGKGRDENDEKLKSKKKKKKRKYDSGVSESSSFVEGKGDVDAAIDTDSRSSVTACENSPSDNLESDSASINLNESVIANLQKEFEKIAAETGSNNSDVWTSLPHSPQNSMPHHPDAKKRNRKRKKGADNLEPGYSNGAGVDDSAVRSVSKSAKKVRFAMKNNLVWKPQNPLPPESLRLPPSVTPRGSALKKGVPPGPIIEMSPNRKRAKKKTQKILRSVTPMVKRQKRIQSASV